MTTVDAPETVRYVKSIPNIIIERPELTMWELIVKHKTPPTRIMRFCCTSQKEYGGKGRIKVTGVRWNESVNRKNNNGLVTIIGKPVTTQKLAKEIGAEYELPKNKKKKYSTILNMDNAETRRVVEHCYRTTSTMLNPIIDWTDNDVWEFLHYYSCNSNPLYACGAKRIGCIGCPMQGPKGMIADFEKYPTYKRAYLRAFDRMLIERKKLGLKIGHWQTAEDVMRWWIGEK